MQSILEELYYGNIRPDSRHYEDDSPFMEAVRRKNQCLEKLTEAMSDYEKDLFEKYCNAQDEIASITRYDTFSYALKFGVLLMKEVFTDEENIYRT